MLQVFQADGPDMELLLQVHPLTYMSKRITEIEIGQKSLWIRCVDVCLA